MFYRGLHCPICATYLGEFEKLNGEKLRIGVDLSLKKAREWGFYISTSRGKISIGIEEPALFSKPGLFMVTNNQSLFYGSVQIMPFVRPHFSQLFGGLDFAIKNDYPARGEYTGAL